MVSALVELQGVEKALASYSEKKVILSYDNSIVSIEKICETLFKTGYVAKLKVKVKTAPSHISDTPFENLDYNEDDLICYCLEHTKDDIEQDFIKNGRSLIMESIVAEKKAGGCDCATKNPKGR